MIEIRGKLSSLFGCANTEINIELAESLLESMINSPIIKDSQCIGIIKHVDKDKDEWIGYLFSNANAIVSKEKCMLIKLNNWQ